MSHLISRRTFHPRVIRRYKSSAPQGPPKNPDSVKLPRERMRALIALYHQADSFITHENLSRRIDEAFLEREIILSHRKLTANNLDQRMQEIREEPLTGMREDFVSNWRRMGRTWSSHASPRALAVQAALYGTYEMDKELPGLETLEEEENKNLPPDS